MTRSWRFRAPGVVVAAACAAAMLLHPADAAAQSSLLASKTPLLKVNWFGPFGISPNDTARFVYTNLGADNVRIEWAFTNAETGELVCGNFGKPVTVKMGTGAIWEYSQTLSVDVYTGQVTETRNCDGQREVTDELYFDKQLRHELVAWIFIVHENARGMANAVDLPTVQLYNSAMIIAPTDNQPTRSLTFGRTIEVIHANPTAPTEFPKALLR